MNKLCTIRRNVSSANNLLCFTSYLKYIYLAKSTSSSHHNSSSSSDSSSSSSDSDTEVDSLKSKPPSAKNKNELALSKLNVLLQQIVEETVVVSESKLDFAKPTNKRIKKELGSEIHKTETIEKQIVNAVKGVAQEIGGDVKQTESELLLKLLSPNDISTEASAMNLSEIVKGMKIDREPKSIEKSRSEQVRNLLQQYKSRSMPTENIQSKRVPRRPLPEKRSPDRAVEKINLFGSEPLGIFINKELKESQENRTWQSLYERDLKLAVTHPPANYFQQMILWTEQGKLWKFPIDNEQGLEEEKQVYFTKHIFLEDHLEPWCPPKGPIRHFMELVCVGLSKNPYLTVEAKKEHIEWYRNYFEDKRKLLQEVGAFPAPSKTEKSLE